MMRNGVAWGLSAVLAAGLLAAGGWMVGEWLLPALAYATGDAIERAAIDTDRRLSQYERSGRPEEMRRWLTTYHGEAPSHQVMISLGKWPLRHPQQFLALVEGLDAKQQATVIQRLAFALSDSGQDTRFVQAFRGYRSPVVTRILRQLRPAE